MGTEPSILSSPGPHDADYLFEEFVNMVEKY
jgi:carbamoylphosphate synthase small subunit